MKKPPETAVILAAGLGSRLGAIKENRPKAFVSVGEETLIERSIRLLKANGISKIIIGTGFEERYFNQLGASHKEITTHPNPLYADSGSMYTLYLLRPYLAGSFLLLESDLLYEEDALRQVLKDERDNIILASGETLSGDEVFVQCNQQGLLRNMSKNVQDLNSVSGELVGICKFAPEAMDAMVRFATSYFTNSDLHLNYEDALVEIAHETDLHVKVVEDLLWCEIDDAAHLERAETKVYPLIHQKENNGNL